MPLGSIRNALSRVVRASSGPQIQTVDVASSAKLIELTHWIDAARVRMMLPAQLLRMQGGFRYDTSHPFVSALEHGEDQLLKFYKDIQPRTLAEFYLLDGKKRAGADLPPWEIPWYKRVRREPPPGEGNLSSDHGVSFYGPASKEKISLEYQRLVNVTDSIRKGGYDPDAYGDIEGYVIKSGTEACFFVRGGKHRVAALVHLGFKSIPVAFRSTFPRLVDSSNSEYWPLVADGIMEDSFAKEMLQVYIHGVGQRKT